MNEAAQEKETSFLFKARYYTLGELSAATSQVWIVLHGYGQLAQYFIRKFRILSQHNIFIIAPEGLSRFYLSELTEQGRKDNKVGATWMTRENRLMDIENYLQYLNSVVKRELGDHHGVPVTLLGFSQGCATVCRWAAQRSIQFQRMILWAGLFPPDMDFATGSEAFKEKKVLMICGRQDPYITHERLEEFDQLAEKLQLAPEKIFFEGGHELNEPILEKLG